MASLVSSTPMNKLVSRCRVGSNTAARKGSAFKIQLSNRRLVSSRPRMQQISCGVREDSAVQLQKAFDKRDVPGADVATTMELVEKEGTPGAVELESLAGSWEIVFSTALMQAAEDVDQKPWYKFFRGYMPRQVQEVVVIDPPSQELGLVTDIGPVRVALVGQFQWEAATSLMTFSFSKAKLGPFEFGASIAAKTYEFKFATAQVAVARSSTGALTGLLKVDSPFGDAVKGEEGRGMEYYAGMVASPLKREEAMTEEELQRAQTADNITPNVKLVLYATGITGGLTLAFLASNGLLFN